jgi:hypothetical protein
MKVMSSQVIGMFKRKCTGGIRFRFLSVTSCILIIGTLVTSLVVAMNDRRMHNNSLITMGSSLAIYIAKLSKEPLLIQDRIGLDAIVNDANKNEYVAYAVIRDNQGFPVTSIYASINYYLPTVKAALLDSPKDNTVSDIINVIKGNGSIMEFSSPITVGSEMIAANTIGTVTVVCLKVKCINRWSRRYYLLSCSIY